MSKFSLKNVLTEKETSVEFPGFPGFEVHVGFLSRDKLVDLKKKSTKVAFKSGQGTTESLNDELFLKLYCAATVKGWKGLKLSYVEQLMPVDLGDEDRSQELPYSEEEALTLMQHSSTFDRFVNETVTELGNFSKTSSK